MFEFLFWDGIIMEAMTLAGHVLEFSFFKKFLVWNIVSDHSALDYTDTLLKIWQFVSQGTCMLMYPVSMPQTDTNYTWMCTAKWKMSVKITKRSPMDRTKRAKKIGKKKTTLESTTKTLSGKYWLDLEFQTRNKKLKKRVQLEMYRLSMGEDTCPILQRIPRNWLI